MLFSRHFIDYLYSTISTHPMVESVLKSVQIFCPDALMESDDDYAYLGRPTDIIQNQHRTRQAVFNDRVSSFSGFQKQRVIDMNTEYLPAINKGIDELKEFKHEFDKVQEVTDKINQLSKTRDTLKAAGKTDSDEYFDVIEELEDLTNRRKATNAYKITPKVVQSTIFKILTSAPYGDHDNDATRFSSYYILGDLSNSPDSIVITKTLRISNHRPNTNTKIAFYAYLSRLHEKNPAVTCTDDAYTLSISLRSLFDEFGNADMSHRSFQFPLCDSIVQTNQHEIELDADYLYKADDAIETINRIIAIIIVLRDHVIIEDGRDLTLKDLNKYYLEELAKLDDTYATQRSRNDLLRAYLNSYKLQNPTDIEHKYHYDAAKANAIKAMDSRKDYTHLPELIDNAIENRIHTVGERAANGWNLLANQLHTGNMISLIRAFKNGAGTNKEFGHYCNLSKGNHMALLDTNQKTILKNFMIRSIMLNRGISHINPIQDASANNDYLGAFQDFAGAPAAYINHFRVLGNIPTIMDWHADDTPETILKALMYWAKQHDNSNNWITSAFDPVPPESVPAAPTSEIAYRRAVARNVDFSQFSKSAETITTRLSAKQKAETASLYMNTIYHPMSDSVKLNSMKECFQLLYQVLPLAKVVLIGNGDTIDSIAGVCQCLRKSVQDNTNDAVYAARRLKNPLPIINLKALDSNTIEQMADIVTGDPGQNPELYQFIKPFENKLFELI